MTGSVADVSTSTSRLPGLDVLRGAAIGLVLLNHFHAVFAGAGIVGVTMFFALSGYLITGLLVRDVYRFGRIRLGLFYRNRALRLIPPMLFMLAGFVVVEGVLNHLGERDKVPQSILVALTYTMNIPGIPHGSESLYHFWTLATEEQFYLVWPLALLLGLHRLGLRRTVALAAAGVAVLCVVSVALTAPDVARIYVLPSSWWLALLIGSASYLGKDAIAARMPSSPRVRRTTQVVVGLLLLAPSFASDLVNNPLTYLVLAPAVAVGTTILIAFARQWTVLPSPALRPLLGLGMVSYSAYLWNAAIMRWIGTSGSVVESLLIPALTLVAALASWWLVEKPVQRWRQRLDARGPALTSAADQAPGRAPHQVDPPRSRRTGND